MTARQAVDVFQQYGEAAIAACQQQRVTYERVKVIDASIGLAGLANSVRAALPTPGLAHAIHNRLTHQPELHHWLHGEKVGFSLLVQSLIEHDGEPDAELLALLRYYDMSRKLPALPGDRDTALHNIAQQITFPKACAERLPFTVSASTLEQACWRPTPFFKRAAARFFIFQTRNRL